MTSSFGLLCSSSFGVKLVISSRENLVTAREVLAAGPQPSPKMETIIITLMHIALYSEKVELEVGALPLRTLIYILFTFFSVIY